MITRFEHIDDIFHFGKFTGCTLAEVLTYNPSYLEWVVKNVDWYYCSLSESALKEIRMSATAKFRPTCEFYEILEEQFQIMSGY